MNIYRSTDINSINHTIRELSDRFYKLICRGSNNDMIANTLGDADAPTEKNQRVQSWTNFIGLTDAFLRRDTAICSPEHQFLLSAVSEGEVEGQRCWIVDVLHVMTDYEEYFHFAVPMGATIMSTALYILQAVRSKIAIEYGWSSSWGLITDIFMDDNADYLVGTDVAHNVLMTGPNGAAIGTSLAVAIEKAAKSKAVDYFGNKNIPDYDIGTMSDKTFFEYNPAHVLAALDVTITFMCSHISAMDVNPLTMDVYALYDKAIYLNTLGASRMGHAISILVDFASRVADRRDLVVDEESVLAAILNGYAYDVSYQGSHLKFDAGRMIASAEYATWSPVLTTDEAAAAVQAALDTEEAAKQHSREMNALVANLNTKSNELLDAVRFMRQTAGDEAAINLGRSLFGSDFTLEKLGEC